MPRTKKPRELTVRVLQSDITGNTGHYDGCHCPIAKAGKRTTRKRYVHASVLFLEVGAKGTKSRVVYRMPDAASRFIRSFDRRHAVSPITFTATEVS